MPHGLLLDPPTEFWHATTTVPLTTIFAVVWAKGDALGPLGLGILCVRWRVRIGTECFLFVRRCIVIGTCIITELHQLQHHIQFYCRITGSELRVHSRQCFTNHPMWKHNHNQSMRAILAWHEWCPFLTICDKQLAISCHLIRRTCEDFRSHNRHSHIIVFIALCNGLQLDNVHQSIIGLTIPSQYLNFHDSILVPLVSTERCSNHCISLHSRVTLAFRTTLTNFEVW